MATQQPRRPSAPPGAPSAAPPVSRDCLTVGVVSLRRPEIAVGRAIECTEPGDWLHDALAAHTVQCVDLPGLGGLQHGPQPTLQYPTVVQKHYLGEHFRANLCLSNVNPHVSVTDLRLRVDFSDAAGGKATLIDAGHTSLAAGASWEVVAERRLTTVATYYLSVTCDYRVQEVGAPPGGELRRLARSFSIPCEVGIEEVLRRLVPLPAHISAPLSGGATLRRTLSPGATPAAVTPQKVVLTRRARRGSSRHSMGTASSDAPSPAPDSTDSSSGSDTDAESPQRATAPHTAGLPPSVALAAKAVAATSPQRLRVLLVAGLQNSTDVALLLGDVRFVPLRLKGGSYACELLHTPEAFGVRGGPSDRMLRETPHLVRSPPGSPQRGQRSGAPSFAGPSPVEGRAAAEASWGIASVDAGSLGGSGAADCGSVLFLPKERRQFVFEVAFLPPAPAAVDARPAQAAFPQLELGYVAYDWRRPNGDGGAAALKPFVWTQGSGAPAASAKPDASVRLVSIDPHPATLGVPCTLHFACTNTSGQAFTAALALLVDPERLLPHCAFTGRTHQPLGPLPPQDTVCFSVTVVPLVAGSVALSDCFSLIDAAPQRPPRAAPLPPVAGIPAGHRVVWPQVGNTPPDAVSFGTEVAAAASTRRTGTGQPPSIVVAEPLVLAD